MGIFDKIKHAIFGEAVAAQPEVQAAQVSTPATPAPKVAAASAAPAAPPASASAPAPAPAQSAPAVAIDVEPILDAAVKKSGQKLDWRHSVVDLMKAVGMDASLAERKELAAELHYAGDTHDTAKMNMWLHKALMKKLSENGGKVPADLLD